VGKIVIGMAISLSGKYATEGTQSLIGALAAAMWVNDQGGVVVGGKRYLVELKYYDDESNPERVTSLVERLITVDGVKFLLAPYGSGFTMRAAPIADKYGVIMVSHGGASDKIFQQGYYYVVQVLTPATKYFVSVLDMVKTLDPEARRVAILYKEHEFSRMVAEGARRYAEELGFEVVFFRSYPKDITDFTPILRELAATKPDVILVASHFQDGQLCAKQLAELNINAKIIAITVAPALPKFYEVLGNLAEGIVYPAQWEIGAKYSPENVPEGYEWYGPTQEEFLEYFRRAAEELSRKGIKVPEKPSYHAAEAAAAVLFIVKAIEKAQSLDPDDVRKAMNELQLYTFFGKIKIDPETGLQVGHEMIVGQWQGGEKKIVWPPEAANSKPFYPIPTWEEKRQGKKAVPGGS
jgi:branched-chain amino acid transport system substrate-binding protein